MAIHWACNEEHGDKHEDCPVYRELTSNMGLYPIDIARRANLAARTVFLLSAQWDDANTHAARLLDKMPDSFIAMMDGVKP